MQNAADVVRELGARLAELHWVTDLWVAGSLATGDHHPGVSDLDLVARTAGPVSVPRRDLLRELHRDLDATLAAGHHLGCVYVADLTDPAQRHPTWTHGRMIDRILSGITRAELVLHGYPVLGRSPADILPPVTPDDVRAAARAELTGYWAWAARRPWIFHDPALADLSLTSMARARHALSEGTLLTKTAAAARAAAPPWLIADLQARRRGETVTSPPWQTARIAWQDARHTVALARIR